MARSPNPPSDNSSQLSGQLPPDLAVKLLDNLDGIVYVADIHTHKILFANRYLKNLFGYDPTGKKCWQFIHPHHENVCTFCDNQELLQGIKAPDDTVYREYQNPFNKKWYAARAQVVEWSDGRKVRLEVALDITEQRELQNFLQEARRQAETAVSTKNRFVALVAHDLKSPFVSILGMLRRILKKEHFDYEIHRTFLENIINNGQQMLKMIDNLLDMDRLAAGKIRPDPCHFKLSEMVGEVFDNFAHLAKKKDLTLLNAVPAGAELYADKYLFFVVVNNLISNAVKFSFKHGEIRVGYQVGEDCCCVTVQDQGQGIPEQFRNDIFKSDVKTSTKGTGGESGSGLGLVFCRQIIEAHGGGITLESSEGRGTTFTVTIGSSCRLSSTRCK